MEKQPLKIIVLGAGPGGLCAAWNLVQDGHRVTVLEKEPVCGGQSITFKKEGYRYDLGPHNIHPQRKSIINFLKGNLGEDFVKHNFYAQIYFRGKRINYPFVGVDVLKSLSFFTAAKCGLSFALSHALSFFIPKFKDDGSYKTWIVNRFGRAFYNIYFGPYSRKVWGVPAEQISDIVAKKRVAVSGIIELIHSIIFKQQFYHPENPSMIENFYPQEGVGAIADFFVKGIRDGGGEIIVGAKVNKIVSRSGVIKEVNYVKDGKVVSLSFDSDKAGRGKVISTIPINEMVLMLEDTQKSEAVKNAAEGLDFTSEVFLYMNINKPHIFGAPLLYFSEAHFPFNRVYDVGIFSRRMVPQGKNALCLEITCNYDDQVWNMDDGAIFEKCIVPLEKHNLLKRSDVESFHTRRLAQAYPRFRVGYEKKLNTIFNYLHGISNLTSLGRQGLFSYANVDDVIWMGFEVAKHVGYEERLSLPIRELLPQYIAF